MALWVIWLCELASGPPTLFPPPTRDIANSHGFLGGINPTQNTSSAPFPWFYGGSALSIVFSAQVRPQRRPHSIFHPTHKSAKVYCWPTSPSVMKSIFWGSLSWPRLGNVFEALSHSSWLGKNDSRLCLCSKLPYSYKFAILNEGFPQVRSPSLPNHPNRPSVPFKL